MDIPKQFQVGKVVYRVTMAVNVYKPHIKGVVYYSTGDVFISARLDQRRKEQTFWHEVVHVALHHMKEHELCKDEKFVDKLATCLAQVVRTAKM